MLDLVTSKIVEEQTGYGVRKEYFYNIPPEAYLLLYPPTYTKPLKRNSEGIKEEIEELLLNQLTPEEQELIKKQNLSDEQIQTLIEARKQEDSKNGD